MPRHGSIKKRALNPDPIHKSRLVTRMINSIMLSGKKSIAEEVVYGAIAELSQDPKEGLQMFEEALKNVMPQVEVRSRRIGGANYQVPVPVRHERGEALAVRWVVDAVRSRKGQKVQEKLAFELKEALKKTGEAMRKKEMTYKMAEANRAFSHFRW